MFTHVHHVHYLVSDLEETIEFMEQAFGLHPVTDESAAPRHADEEGIREAQYRVGETLVEFTQPLVAESRYGRRLAEHGPHVLHVAWGVPSIDDASASLSDAQVPHAVKAGPRGYRTINIDLAASGGIHVQLAGD